MTVPIIAGAHDYIKQIRLIRYRIGGARDGPEAWPSTLPVRVNVASKGINAALN